MSALARLGRRDAIVRCMDIKYYDDGSHSGSGLGSDSNGPVPQPGPFAVPIMPVSPSGGTPIEPDSKLDGLSDQGFNANGASPAAEGGNASAPSPDSIAQPASGAGSPMTRSYPA